MRITIVLALLSLSTLSFGQRLRQETIGEPEIPGFIENKGQVADQAGDLRPDVKYMYCVPGFKLILKETGLSYEFSRAEAKENNTRAARDNNKSLRQSEPDKRIDQGGRTVYTSRVDIEFNGANPDPEIIAEGQSETYLNYYKGYLPEEGITHVYSYHKVIYRNVYPQIDFVFYTQGKDGLKYDIIVRLGGRLSDVRLAYTGMDELGLKDGKLHMSARDGWLSEEIPVSYTKETGERRPVQYELTGNTVQFTGEKEAGLTLVVDPLMSWATYYGGTENDGFLGITTDASGNAYAAGVTNSASAIATSGVHLNVYQGTGDAFIVKFNSNGTRQWATYYGGSEYDAALDIAADPFANLFVVGRTRSTTGIATSGASSTSKSGPEDGFVAKFTSTGARTWGTYIGSLYYDECSAVTADTSGNAYVIGYMENYNSAPNNNDVFLVKFFSAGGRSWTSYLKGSGTESAEGVTVDRYGNIYVAGSTVSTSGIATTGAYQSAKKKFDDAFLAKFNKSGKRIWGTYYGDDSYDYGVAVSSDADGNIYLAGNTRSTSGIATSGSYRSSISGTSDGFLTKFDSSGKRLWATYVGGNDVDGIIAMDSDSLSNLYLAGSTTSTADLASEGAYKTSHSASSGFGDEDVFLWKSDSSGGRLWASYYGGNASDWPEGIAVHKIEYVYIVGTTDSKSDIATSGAHQTSRGSLGYNDGFMARFLLEADPSLRSAITSKGNNCGKVKDTLKVRVRNFGDKPVKSLKISYTINGKTAKTISYTKTIKPFDSTSYITLDTVAFAVGKNTVKIWTSMPNGVADPNPGNDSLTIVVTINPSPVPSFTFSNACTRDSISFANKTTIASGSAISSYLWKFGDGSFSLRTNPTKTYDSAGQYTVWLIAVSDKGCSDSFSTTITIYPRVEVSFEAVDDCVGSPIAFINKSIVPPGSKVSYFWIFGLGPTSTDTNPVRSYTKAGSYKVSLVVITDKGCSDTFSRIVTIFPRPSADFTGASSCQSSDILFQNSSAISSGVIVEYVWKFGDGDSAASINPSHSYSSPGTYRVWLFTTSDRGCRDSTSKLITVFPRPQVDFAAGDACVDAPISFTNNTKILSGNVSGYLWKFGDGTSSSAINPSKTYSSAGAYTVTLIATSDRACIDSFSKTITISPLPEAGFTAVNGCVPEPIAFTNTSTIPAGSIKSYSWSFGDGAKSTLRDPAHVYTKAGSYTARLTVYSAAGCADSISREVIVFPLPNTKFTSTHVQGGEYSFVPEDSNAAGYLWHFGDGDSSVLKAPDHTYKADGTYAAQLRVTSSEGCVSANNQNITVSTVGLRPLKEGDKYLQLYPNPFQNTFTLKVPNDFGGKAAVEVYTGLGKRIYFREMAGMQKQAEIDLSFVAGGVYLVRVIEGKNVYTGTIVKQ